MAVFKMLGTGPLCLLLVSGIARLGFARRESPSHQGRKKPPVFLVLSELGFSPVLGLSSPPNQPQRELAPLASLRQPQLINV